MDTPYRLEAAYTQVSTYSSAVVTSYMICGPDGAMCRGTDVVFLHHVVDLLNADWHQRERPQLCSSPPGSPASSTDR
jgi:hypothetical protein